MDLTDGFRIGDWDVLPLEGRIVRAADGESRRVRRKAMDVLCTLAAHSGQVVERDAVLSAVWGRTAVTDEPLTATIGELRRLLGERQGFERRYIDTIPKRGYRLLPDVLPRGGSDLPVAKPAATPEPASPTTAADEMRAAGSSRLPPAVRFDWKALSALVVLLVAAILAVQRLTTLEEVPVPERSLAVLPFEDLSPGADQRYFADGLAEELISLLTRLPSLKVAARNSAFSFRGQRLDAGEIAGRLKVAHVLTGSVQRIGEQVRVTAQLVDARAGYQLWSESYDRTLDDIFAIQDDIAGQVTEQLRVQLLGKDVRVRETDTRAYTLYLQARHIGRQHTEEGLKSAAELYRQALEIDPGYLPALNELAGVYSNMTGFAMLPRDEGYRLAREAAYNALALEPDYAPAHDRLGWLALHEDGDFAAAAEHYRRALALEPDNDVIRSNAALVALALGRLDTAIELFEGSAVSDPVSAISHANLANAYLLARRYEEAERSIRNALTLSPQYAAGHYRLGRVLLAQGDLAGAREAVEAEPFPAARLLGLAFLHDVEGRREESDAALEELRALYGDRGAGNYAQVYAHRRDVDAAFQWLDVELAANGAGSFTEHRWDPLMDPLREDPRWSALMERAGLAEAELAAVAFPTLEELAAGPD